MRLEVNSKLGKARLLLEPVVRSGLLRRQIERLALKVLAHDAVGGSLVHAVGREGQPVRRVPHIVGIGDLERPGRPDLGDPGLR